MESRGVSQVIKIQCGLGEVTNPHGHSPEQQRLHVDLCWGGENIFYKNDPAFNPCIDCFLFTYQKLGKKYKNTIFWHKTCLKYR